MTAKGESLLSKFKLYYEYQEDDRWHKELVNRVKQIKRRRTLKKKEKAENDAGRAD